MYSNDFAPNDLTVGANGKGTLKPLTYDDEDGSLSTTSRDLDYNPNRGAMASDVAQNKSDAEFAAMLSGKLASVLVGETPPRNVVYLPVNGGIIMDPAKLKFLELETPDLTDDALIRAQKEFSEICNYLPAQQPTFSQNGSLVTAYQIWAGNAYVPPNPLNNEMKMALGHCEQILNEGRVKYEKYRTLYDAAASEVYIGKLTPKEKMDARWRATQMMLEKNAKNALSNWNNFGNKMAYEKAEKTRNVIMAAGPSSVLERIQSDLQTRADGASSDHNAFPVSVMPNNFATEMKWNTFTFSNSESFDLKKSESMTVSAGASVGWGGFSFGGSGGYSKASSHEESRSSDTKISFEYCRTPIIRDWFDPTFMNSQLWYDRHAYQKDPNPTGSIVSEGKFQTGKDNGYLPAFTTDIVWVRNVKLAFTFDSATADSTSKTIEASASVGWGPFAIKGSYGSTKSETKIEKKGNTMEITMPTLQITGFLAAVTPPSPRYDPSRLPKDKPSSAIVADVVPTPSFDIIGTFRRLKEVGTVLATHPVTKAITNNLPTIIGMMKDVDGCTEMPTSVRDLLDSAAIAHRENPTNSPTNDQVSDVVTHGGSAPLHLAIYTSKKWANGRALKVYFLQGSQELQERILDVANSWNRVGANISFVRTTNIDESQVRVNLQSTSNSSAVGIDAELPKYKGQATLNLANVTEKSTKEQLNRAVVHEFGHVLGLVHEHQSPKANLEWNLDAVYTYFKGTQGWDYQTTYANVVAKYNLNSVNASDFDPQSIMLYPFDAACFKNGVGTGWNTRLSAKDIQFIKEWYPKGGAGARDIQARDIAAGIHAHRAHRDYREYEHWEHLERREHLEHRGHEHRGHEHHHGEYESYDL